ncbi:acyltransferase [Sphingobium sp. SCG-1]|uniref:acyltransferase family protein n=1 Tax=Sphingobium sp. SCG-1 TaxID=2072936 RepID=UPI000CD6B307|nr:acyltransferase [Sphingobium sp. SCG-1]AUW59250.1 acyltransferase [Sphingobium sp. SCG-1]
MTGELKSLTAARGLAAWLVVLYHIRSGANWAPDWLFAFASKGYLAVDFFFLLSGFVIYLSAHRAMLRDGTAAIAPFLIRRFARIYPLYGFMLALTLLFVLLLHATGDDPQGYPMRELPLHIAMLQNWGFTEKLAWNHPAWSISAEMAAYLLFPIIILGTPISETRRPNLLAAMILTLATLFVILHFNGETTLGRDIPHFGLLRCLAEFTCGVLLCAFWLRGPDGEVYAFGLSLGGVAMFWGLWLTGLASELWAFPAGAACLILALAHSSAFRHNPLHIKPLITLGEISYGTYLSHFMLYVWFKIIFVADPHAVPPILMLSFLALTLAASFLLHHWIEKPGRDWAMAFRKRLPPRLASRPS